MADATPAAAVAVEADDEGQQVNPRFVPNTIEGRADKVLEIDIKNVGTVAHHLRVSGVDREYDTNDDFRFPESDGGTRGEAAAQARSGR